VKISFPENNAVRCYDSTDTVHDFTKLQAAQLDMGLPITAD